MSVFKELLNKTIILESRDITLSSWGLDDLVKGLPVILYHGTTSTFKKFDIDKSRYSLVNKFYGPGIFLVPSIRVAEKYAEANRNIGFPKTIITDLAKSNKGAALLLKNIYTHGQESGWNMTMKPFITDKGLDHNQWDKFLGGIDGNRLTDISKYIIGNKTERINHNDPINIFSNETGLPTWVYTTLDDVGINSKLYRPKVYTVTVTVKNTLVTANKAKAKKAKSKGYDSVIFHGADLVDNVPEVAVFNAQHVRIKSIKVV